MADRVVKVTLRADIQSYLSGMDKAAQKTRETGSEAEKLAQKKEAFNIVGASALAAGGAIAIGVGMAISKFAEFDAQMSSVQAATHESATNMVLLREAAIQAGADTVFSATEAAAAEEELAKAGVSTADILGGGLKGALDLASAGQLNVADAAEIAATAMTQFKLNGSQVPHIADLLAAGAGKAQGSVEDLSQALNQGGLVASQTGLSIEETTGTLSAFASAGLLGSDAGTSFKTMLQRLTPQSAEAKAKMDELGISAYDAQGQFIGISKFAGVLQNALKDLSPEARNAALSVIFGSDSVRAASVLYEQGASGIQSWIDKTNDSGYAALTAAMKLDNLQGDVEKLSGSFDTALIQSGSAANDLLRNLVQTVNGVVDGFNGLPQGVQNGALAFGGVAAAIGIVGGAALLAVPKIAEMRTAFDRLNLSGGRLAGIIGKGGLVTLGLVAVTGALSQMGSSGSLAADQLAQVNSAIDTGRLRDLNKQFLDGNGNIMSFEAGLKSIASGNFFENSGFAQGISGALDAVTFGATHLSDNVNRIKGTFKELGQTLGETAKSDFPEAVNQFKALVVQTDGSEESIRQLLTAMPEYKAALIDLAGQQGQNLSDQQLYNLAVGEGSVASQLFRDAASNQAVSLGDVSQAATDATGKVKELGDAIAGFGQAQFDTERASITFNQALNELAAVQAPAARDAIIQQRIALGDTQAAAEKYADSMVGSLDVTTEAGQRTLSSMLDTAKATNDYAASVLATGGSTEQVQGILEAGRQKIIDTRIALGDSADAAQAYADKLIATPAVVTTQVNLAGAENAKAILDNLTKNRTVLIQAAIATGADPGAAKAAYNANGGMYAYASGGFGTGIYSGRQGAIYKFAEPETKWEAFISGRPGQESRNRGIWAEAGRRLGVQPMASQVSVSPVVSLAGARIAIDIGGRQLEGVIQDQIVAADAATEATANAGWRRER